MLTGRQIAYQIYAFFNINDVQRDAIGMNDVRNIEFRTDNQNVSGLVSEGT